MRLAYIRIGYPNIGGVIESIEGNSALVWEFTKTNCIKSLGNLIWVKLEYIQPLTYINSLTELEKILDYSLRVKPEETND